MESAQVIDRKELFLKIKAKETVGFLFFKRYNFQQPSLVDNLHALLFNLFF